MSIDEINEEINELECRVLDKVTELQEDFETFGVAEHSTALAKDFIEIQINCLRRKVNEMEDYHLGLLNEISEAESEIEKLERGSSTAIIPEDLQTIRLMSVLETILHNIRYIDVEDLEALANKTPLMRAK